MANKNILDIIVNGTNGLSRRQIQQAALDKLTEAAKVAPIVIPKGQNLKGWKIPMDASDVGYMIGNEGLRKKISLDPLTYDPLELESINEWLMDCELTNERKRFHGETEDPLPGDIQPNYYYRGGFDLDKAKIFASSVLTGETPEIVRGAYKVVNASPDGRAKLKVVYPDGKRTVTIDENFKPNEMFGNANRVAKPGSTGQWANIAGKLYNVDFNSTVPVSFVRDRNIDGRNFTDFNPNLKKYRNGFPVRELPVQDEYSRIGRIKRSTRRDLRHSGDPYSVPADENTETPFMAGAKYKADMIRAKNAGLQFDNRLQQIRNEEDEIDRQIEALKAKRDSIRDVYWGVRDLKDSVMNAAKIYNRR